MSLWERVTATSSRLASAGESLRSLAGGVASPDLIDKLLGFLGRDRDAPDAQDDVVFTIGLIALCAKMAKADGAVTSQEVEAFNRVFLVPPDEARNVHRFFDLARGSVEGYQRYARQLARRYRDRPGVLEDVLDALFHIAKADRVIHDDELAYLADVARIFGFTEFEYQRIEAGHLGAGSADPYLILGLDHAATRDDVKRAYRRMVKENHPDALVARGVPPEFIAIANEKLAVINEAYRRIMDAG